MWSNVATWLIGNAKQDRQSITKDWQSTEQSLIEGVRIKEVLNVPKENGYLTELFRRDWGLDDLPVDQVFQVTLFPKAVSAWHAHEKTTDRLFVTEGIIKIVLYDGRRESKTYQTVNVFKTGAIRPMLVLIPPQVWHGVQNLGNESGRILNLVDRAYRYESPDHWRLPSDTADIPYRFFDETTLNDPM